MGGPTVPINDITIWRLNEFDKMLADERIRTSEPPPPLIHLSQQKGNEVQVITNGIGNDYGLINGNNDNDDHDIDPMHDMNDDTTIINE